MHFRATENIREPRRGREGGKGDSLAIRDYGTASFSSETVALTARGVRREVQAKQLRRVDRKLVAAHGVITVQDDV